MKSAIFLVLSLALIAGAVFAGIGTKRFLNSALTAPGRVTELRAGGSHPTIQFTTATGRTVSYPQNGFIFHYKVGDAVRVRYLAQDAEATATVDDFGALWTVSMALGFIGLGFLAVAAAEFTNKRGS